VYMYLLDHDLPNHAVVICLLFTLSPMLVALPGDIMEIRSSMEFNTPAADLERNRQLQVLDAK